MGDGHLPAVIEGVFRIDTFNALTGEKND